jgi:hypothetical protein
MSLTCPMSCWTSITRWSSLYHLDLYIFLHDYSPLTNNGSWCARHCFTLSIYIVVNCIQDEFIMLLFLLILLFYLIQGKDYRSQLQLGNGALFGASYIQVQYVRYMIVLGIKLIIWLLWFRACCSLKIVYIERFFFPVILNGGFNCHYLSWHSVAYKGLHLFLLFSCIFIVICSLLFCLSDLHNAECDPSYVFGCWSILGWSASKIWCWICWSVWDGQDGNWFGTHPLLHELSLFNHCVWVLCKVHWLL